MIIGTKQEFENLADYVLRDYLGSEYESSYSPFDVNAFAEEYLKLEISFFDFNPEENIEGMRIGNKIILDSRLCEPMRVGECNFTVAHECGHEIINWQDPSYVPYQITNYRFKNQHKELKTEDDFKEWQANVVASCLLLRPNLVMWSMDKFLKADKLTVFGDCRFYALDLYYFKMMARYLGVSQTCLFYRLNCLGLLNHQPDSAYDPRMDILYR